MHPITTIRVAIEAPVPFNNKLPKQCTTYTCDMTNTILILCQDEKPHVNTRKKLMTSRTSQCCRIITDI